MTSASPLECLVNGDSYRVEIYIDGALAGQDEGTVAAPLAQAPDTIILQPVDSQDLGAAFCRPAAWTLSTDSEPGLEVGYVGSSNAGQARGLFVFRIDQPKAADGNPGDTAGAIAQVLADARLGTALPALVLFSEDNDATFFDLTRVIKRWYNMASDGTARVVAGAETDGTVMVAIVFGPSTDFDAGGIGLRLIDALLPHH